MTEQKNTDTPFSYKYNEDEGVVSVYANGIFITDLQDENGDPEICFHWFCQVYSKTNLALGYNMIQLEQENLELKAHVQKFKDGVHHFHRTHGDMNPLLTALTQTPEQSFSSIHLELLQRINSEIELTEDPIEEDNSTVIKSIKAIVEEEIKKVA